MAVGPPSFYQVFINTSAQRHNGDTPNEGGIISPGRNFFDKLLFPKIRDLGERTPKQLLELKKMSKTFCLSVFDTRFFATPFFCDIIGRLPCIALCKQFKNPCLYKSHCYSTSTYPFKLFNQCSTKYLMAFPTLS